MKSIVPADAKQLRRELRQLGLSSSAITAAWPGWWSDDAETSASARAELRFSLARKLGLDPRSLLDEQEPRFVWRDEAKFKHLSTQDSRELAAINSFGTAIGRMLIAAANHSHEVPLRDLTAAELRQSILARQNYVRLVDLLALCWAIRIPVIHLRVFPLSAKRMCAMTVRVDNRFAILMGKDSNYPAPTAYYLAHEIGHIALGHVQAGSAVVDLDDLLGAKALENDRDDPEEIAADRFALEVLTGKPDTYVGTEAERYTANALALSIFRSFEDLHIEPGTLALCFGHATGEWQKANAAMKIIYKRSLPVWAEINKLATNELNWTALPDDIGSYLKAVMGGPTHGGRRSR